jgi:hypothetical protein
VFLYDHKDITSFFSDAAMTTQAVVNGPVGAVRDSSGNGRHRRQSDNAKRPTLRQSGGLYYISYNGTSHFLVTDPIDLTGTNALTLCFGVTKSSDAATGIAVEVGVSINSTAGIALYAPTSAGPALGFGSRGTATVLANYNNALVAAPITRVLTGVAKISTDKCILRANGTQIPRLPAIKAPGTTQTAPFISAGAAAQATSSPAMTTAARCMPSKPRAQT